MATSSLRSVFLVFSVLLCAVLVPAADDDAPLSAADAARLIGQLVTGPKKIGPMKDDDSPAQATHWTYRGKDGGVVCSRLDFASAAEAAKFVTAAFIKKQTDEDDAKVTPEPGVGDRAFWATTGNGCSLTFLKGSHLASIALGGPGIGSPESHKAALKAAAITLAAKL